MPRPDPQDRLLSFENQGQNALSDLSKMTSSFSGLNTAGDVRSRYGIADSKTMFAPLYQRLAGNRARRMQGAATRAGRSASPEMTFSNVEADYENSLQGLMGDEARSDQEQQRFVASLLGNAQGARDSFGLNRTRGMSDMASGLARNRLNWAQFDREGEGPGFWDIAGSILGTGAQVAGSYLGAPRTDIKF